MTVEPVRTWSKRCDAIFPCPNAVGRCHRVAWINVLLSKWGTNNFWLSNEWHLMRLTRKKWSFISTSSSFSYRWWYFSIEFCVAVFRITSQLAAQSQRLMDCWLPQLFPMEALFEDQKHIAWFLVEPLLFLFCSNWPSIATVHICEMCRRSFATHFSYDWPFFLYWFVLY